MKNRLKVLFVELNFKKTSPTITLAKAIEREGAQAKVIDISAISSIELIKLYLKFDVLIIQFYGVIDHYARKQIALAILLGVPVIRTWAGTDVLKSLNEVDVRVSSLRVNQLINKNITVAHTGLVNWLSSIGIDCVLSTKVIDKLFVDKAEEINLKPMCILAYLPSQNREFYGAKYIEHLMIKFPQLRFIVVADTEHYFEKYPNVKSLGLVDEMEAVWEQVGLLVRITEHDGYPRMNLEALARGKYVIHNNRLPGVWFAETFEQLDRQVQRFIDVPDTNHEGLDIAKKLLNCGAERELLEHYSSNSVSFTQWCLALKEIVLYYFSPH